jgi:hypothetical protein
MVESLLLAAGRFGCDDFFLKNNKKTKIETLVTVLVALTYRFRSDGGFIRGEPTDRDRERHDFTRL